MRLKNVTSGRRAATGFTLVELMTVVTIFAILAMLGVPMYATFMANTQIRSAAESISGGLRLARAEAVKRNGRVEFVLDTATGWQVNDVSSNERIQGFKWVDGAPRAAVSAPNGTKVQFDGLGRVLLKDRRATSDDAAPTFDVTASVSNAEPRPLRVIVDTQGGGVRMCDPKLPSADPAGCPQTS